MKQRELLDSFKSATGLTTDAAVGKVFDQAHSNVSAWSAGRKPIPLEIKLRILDHIDFSRETQRFVAVLGDLSTHLLKLEEEKSRIQALRDGPRKTKDDATSSAEVEATVEMLDETQALNRLTDEKLCEILGISIGELSEIRARTKNISAASKRRLLPLWGWSKARERAKETPLPKVFEPFRNFLYEWDIQQVQK